MTWLFSFAARARSARAANDTTWAQINNIPSKSHVIPLLINLIEPGMEGYSCGIHAFLNVYQLKSSKGNVQKVEFVVFDIKRKLFIQLRSGSLFGKSTRRGSIYRQSGFRHGCDARWNSLKYKWNLLTKFPQSWGHPKGNLSALWFSLIYKSTKFPDTSLWEKDDLLVRCDMDVFIFGVIIFVP